MRLASDPEMDGWFEIREAYDFAQAAVDRWSNEQKEREPGVYPVVVNVKPPTEVDGGRPHDPGPDSG
jgi:hypothetical protein